MNNHLFCNHENWQAKLIPLSNGRPALYEFCVNCGLSNGGGRLGFALPMVSDMDLLIPSYKYSGKTLGEIEKIDRSYLKWIVLESKSSDRIKKSAARVYFHCPYSFTIFFCII